MAPKIKEILRIYDYEQGVGFKIVAQDIRLGSVAYCNVIVLWWKF